MSAQRLFSAVALAVTVLGSGLACQPTTGSQITAPRYEPVPTWPMPLPDQWVLGGLGGVCVDAQDHVLVLNRQTIVDGDLNAGILAPAVIEFDAAGNVVHSWGDSRLLDPRLHACHFDSDGNVWIASSPSGMVQKYSHDGSQLLLQIGDKGVFDSSDGTAQGVPLNSAGTRFYMPASVVVDRQTGEVYVADGESVGGNRRIAVMDESGLFLRQWLLDHMESVHCMVIANDGEVYVCNRFGSRIELYDKRGTATRSIAVPWVPVTPPSNAAMQYQPSGGSAVAIAFSPDSEQRLMFVINQENARVEIIERKTGLRLGSFGRAGSFPGEFNQAHGIAVDSKGNIYVAENRGRRIHKFQIAR